MNRLTARNKMVDLQIAGREIKDSLGYLKVGTTWVTGSEDLEAEHDGREDDEREGVNEDGDDSDLEPNLSPVF